MALPTEIDFYLIKLGDGADPEVFTLICGIQDATVNESVETNNRFVRDCAKPGEVPYRKVRTTGRLLEISGSGMTNAAEVTRLDGALGKSRNYRVEGYRDDGTDAGELLVTYEGAFVLSTNNQNVSRDQQGTGDITILSDGVYTKTVE